MNETKRFNIHFSTQYTQITVFLSPRTNDGEVIFIYLLPVICCLSARVLLNHTVGVGYRCFVMHWELCIICVKQSLRGRLSSQWVFHLIKSLSVTIPTLTSLCSLSEEKGLTILQGCVHFFVFLLCIT